MSDTRKEFEKFQKRISFDVERIVVVDTSILIYAKMKEACWPYENNAEFKLNCASGSAKKYISEVFGEEMLEVTEFVET